MATGPGGKLFDDGVQRLTIRLRTAAFNYFPSYCFRAAYQIAPRQRKTQCTVFDDAFSSQYTAMELEG
jgi:hypothetical protein